MSNMLKKFNKAKPLFLLPALALTIFFASNAVSKQADHPKLVLQITVDQLRGDMPFRFQDRFVKGGFNYLLKNGTVYRDAHHAHANTETIVGHVTLATGTYPSEHGLIGNAWYDRDQAGTVYNIEDENYSLLNKNADVDKKTEIDPTQKTASSDGRSPNSIKSSTFSDEMVIASAGDAKVFGISIKDRGAVSMAGHGGKALWFSKKAQEFVSSDYYFDKYPQWVNDWNAEKKASKYKDTKWTLLHDKSTYVYGKHDDRDYEMDLAGYGKIFPHPLGHSKYFSTLLTANPAGDELTADFAKHLILSEKMGKDDVTDYLSISFSATDYIGHFFGASSLEAEDNMLRLDRTLADLFKFIDEHVGIENTIIVLSSDHGGPETPGYLAENKLLGSYVDPKKWDELPVIANLKKQLKVEERLIEAYYHPYIYLDKVTLAKNNLDVNSVQDKVAAVLQGLADVKLTVASNKVVSGLLADNRINTAISNNYYEGRSGDVYVVFAAQDFVNKLDGLTVPSMHGSPWTYDTYVPVMFAGKNITAKHIYRRVETVDVAPTMSALLNIKAPSATSGNILTEVFDKQ